MNIFTIIWDGVRRRKIRSALSILGIAVAAAALFSMISLRDSYQSGLQAELEHMGAQVVAVAKGCPYEAAAILMTGGQVPASLPEAVVEQIRSIPNVQAASPNVYGAYHHGETVHPLVGITSEELELKPWWRIQGRFPEQFGEVVLGSGELESYARNGEKISLGDSLHVSLAGETMALRVVGILDKTGSKDDYTSFTTLETAQELFKMQGRVVTVNIRVKDIGALPETIENVEAIPDVQAVTVAQVMGTLQSLVQTGQNLLFMVMLVALLVGGLGTMNTMLMAVFERTREIGMMKAVGATRNKIFQMFLLEGVLICLTGGIIGAAAGWMVTLLGDRFLSQFVSVMPTRWTGQVSWYALGISIGFPFLVGVISTLYPAYRASGLNPMEALRSE